MPIPFPKDPLSSSDHSAPTSTVTSKPYPAATKTASASLTTNPPVTSTVTLISFSDRLLITIVQSDRGLAQWYQVPLDISGPMADDPYFSAASAAGGMSTDREDGLLPGSEFTPRSLLGGGAAAGTERETLGQLFASQIASAIKVKEAGEKRVLALGLGLDLRLMGEGEKLREVFGEIMGLVLRVL